jgi:UDP-N-acetylmuramate--alanine ligase
MKKDEKAGTITINCSGMHNIPNSLAACVVAMEMGIKFETAKKALLKYRGVGRRLERVGDAGGVVFYDDYAHHPTEISLSLRSLRAVYPNSKIIAVFQPHRYTRTRDLAKKFPASLEVADIVYVTDIYPAGEIPIEGVTSLSVVNNFSDRQKVKYAPNTESLIKECTESLKSGDVLVTLGAGNVYNIGSRLIAQLNEKKS